MLHELLHDYELQSGLNRLRYSFVFSVIGNLVTFVPGIGLVGGLLSSVAFILLILGWRALGRSSLNKAQSYHTTSNVLIITLVIAIVAAIVGIITAAGALAGAIATNPPAPGQPSPILSTIPGFETFMMNVFITLVIVGAIAALGQLRSAISLRSLSVEISEPRLRTSGNLFILALILSIASQILLVPILPGFIGSLSSSELTALSSEGSPIFLIAGGRLFVLGVVSLIQFAIILTAYILGYMASNNARTKLQFSSIQSPYYGGFRPYTPPPPPHTSQVTPMDSRPLRTCPACGTELQWNANFCTNCGKNVS